MYNSRDWVREIRISIEAVEARLNNETLTVKRYRASVAQSHPLGFGSHQQPTPCADLHIYGELITNSDFILDLELVSKLNKVHHLDRNYIDTAYTGSYGIRVQVGLGPTSPVIFLYS